MGACFIMKIIYFKGKNGKIYDNNSLAIKASALAIPASVLLSASPVSASSSVNVTQAMQPLINALKDMAEPVSYAFMIYGGIKYISGHSAEGQKILKSAIGGYILIQWIPWIFDMIRKIGVGGQ